MLYINVLINFISFLYLITIYVYFPVCIVLSYFLFFNNFIKTFKISFFKSINNDQSMTNEMNIYLSVLNKF